MSAIPSAILGLPVAALALASLSFSTQGPGAQAPDLSGVIGVVNALQVQAAYEKAIEGNQSLRQLNDRFQESADKMEEAIQQLKLEIMALDNSAQQERNMKSLQLDLAQRELQGREVLHREQMLRESAALSVQIYEDIWAASAKVAQAKGLKLVLRMRELQTGAPLDIRQAFHDRRNVLYAAPELDLTQDVINMLKL